jgi:hypothetical protein
MKPNPFVALNHFTLPVAIRLSSGRRDAAPLSRPEVKSGGQSASSGIGPGSDAREIF